LKKSISISFLFVLALSKFIFAQQESIILNDTSSSFDVYKHLYLYKEEKKIYTISEVSKPNFPFVANKGNSAPNLGFTESNYWFIFSVKNNWTPKKLILEIPYPFFNQLEIYFVKHGKITNKEIVGDHLPFAKRKINNKNFIFELDFAPNDETKIFAHILCDGEATSFPVRLLKSIELSEYYYQEQLLLGFYYGVLLFALFLSFFLGVSLKESINFWYFLYILSIGIFQLALDGLAFQYLWPNNIWLANHIIPLAGSAGIFFLLQFTQSLLLTKKLAPLIYNTLNLVAAIVFVFFIASMFNNPLYSWSLKGLNLLGLIANLLVLAASIVVLRRNYKPARYFLIAFSLLIVGILLALLKNFGILPRVFLTEYGIQMGSAIEIIFLSFALSERVKVLKDEKTEVQNLLIEQYKENNRIQAEINVELERKVEERTSEISEQNKIISEKNKDITDSINYAKRIQEALLPKEEVKMLTSENFFVLYKPRDIVSGDFYWFEEQNGILIFCVADCTGHGVPGALMSMIGATNLRQILDEPVSFNAADILNRLDKKIIESLKQQSELNPTKDGMDTAICLIDTKKNTAVFAGALRPMVLIRENEIIAYSSSSYSIGGYNPEIKKVFTNHVIELKKGDTIYMFSDGYADQFGGEKNKKLMIKNFKNNLSKISNYPMDKQKELLHKTFEDWRGNNEQVDDVLVMGIKIE
jgi:hypothetical protein